MVSRQWPPPEAAPAWPACCSLSSRKSTVTGCNAPRRSRMTSAVARIMRTLACGNLSSRLRRLRAGGLVLHVLREPHGLRENEAQHQAEATEHLEIDPRIEREVERDPQVERALEEEEDAPRDGAPRPHRSGKGHAFPHHRPRDIGLAGERHQAGCAAT